MQKTFNSTYLRCATTSSLVQLPNQGSLSSSVQRCSSSMVSGRPDTKKISFTGLTTFYITDRFYLLVVGEVIILIPAFRLKKIIRKIANRPGKSPHNA